eukprot:2423143-Ditylum_brightwellii.AAC.1
MKCKNFGGNCLTTKYGLPPGLIVIMAKSDDGIWEESFKAVNLNPHHHVSFEEWLKRIADHVEMEEQFFKKDVTAM